MCVSSEQCVLASQTGICQPNGYCSFEDRNCDGQPQRFGEHAPPGIAGQCVDEVLSEPGIAMGGSSGAAEEEMGVGTTGELPDDVGESSDGSGEESGSDTGIPAPPEMVLGCGIDETTIYSDTFDGVSLSDQWEAFAEGASGDIPFDRDTALVVENGAFHMRLLEEGLEILSAYVDLALFVPASFTITLSELEVDTYVGVYLYEEDCFLTLEVDDVGFIFAYGEPGLVGVTEQPEGPITLRVRFDPQPGQTQISWELLEDDGWFEIATTPDGCGIGTGMIGWSIEVERFTDEPVEQAIERIDVCGRGALP